VISILTLETTNEASPLCSNSSSSDKLSLQQIQKIIY